MPPPPPHAVRAASSLTSFFADRRATARIRCTHTTRFARQSSPPPVATAVILAASTPALRAASSFWYCRQSFTSSRPVPTSSVLRGFRKMNCLLTDHCFVGLSITGLSFCGKLVCGFWIVDYWRIILKIVRKRKLQFFNRFEIGLWDFQLGESQKFCNGQQTIQF